MATVSMAAFGMDSFARTFSLDAWKGEEDNYLLSCLKYFHVDIADVWKMMLMIVLWKVIHVQSANLLRSIVLETHPRLKGSVSKLSESIWMCFFYVLAWAFIIKYMFEMKQNLFYVPYHSWEDVHPEEYDRLSQTSTLVYLFHISFYWFLLGNPVKKTKKEKHRYLLCTRIFHTLCIAFLSLLYLLSNFKLGLLFCFMYDLIGLQLESVKLIIYSVKLKLIDRMYGNIAFGLYCLHWLFLTFYLFPAKILYYSILVMLTRHDRPLVELISFIALLVEIYNLYHSKNLLVWIFKLKNDDPTQVYILYQFFFEVMPIVTPIKTAEREPSPKVEETTPHRAKQPMPDAVALIQTIRCMIYLKRKLKRMREEKLKHEAAENELIDTCENDQPDVQNAAVDSDAKTLTEELKEKFLNVPQNPSEETDHVVADDMFLKDSCEEETTTDCTQLIESNGTLGKIIETEQSLDNEPDLKVIKDEAIEVKTDSDF